MTAAETLRAAASLMRERAEAANPHGPWYDEIDLIEALVPLADVTDSPAADGRFLASWHPAVALAVADWLESVADGWADDPGCDLGGGYDFSPACESCFRCYYYETQMRALAVANAYLGGEQR